MSSIRIVTDSTADLEESFYRNHNIAVVPLKVIFGQQVLKDGIDISATDFYNRLINTNEIVTTSQPSPGEFLETYKRLKDEGAETIISIHLSSGISGAYRTAQMVRNMLPDQDITVIDSQSVSGGLGLIIMAAVRAVESGQSKEQILSLVNDIIKKMKLYLLVDTLEYLQRGGRISKTQAFVGALLNIKPLIAVKDGILHPLMKVRGKNKGIQKIIQLAAQDSENEKIVCCVAHARDQKALIQIKERAMLNLNIDELFTGQIGSVIGTHTGPGTVGIAFYKK